MMLAHILLQLAYLACAAAALAVAGWTMARHRRRWAADLPVAAALVLTACWALTQMILGPAHAGTDLAVSLSYLGWLWVLHSLFSRDARARRAGPVRPVLAALALVEGMSLLLVAAQVHFAGEPSAVEVVLALAMTFRLLFCVGALVLVHNLYAGAVAEARERLRWTASALALIWLYDLNLSTIAYLGGGVPELLAELRAPAMLLVAALLAIGATRHEGSPRFRPSRAFAFQSLSLLVIGGYLLAMVLVAQGLAYAGGDWAQTAQVVFIAAAGALALVVLPSRKLRGWLRVTLSKHLFQHRYDYRAEWQRFTGTIGRAGPDAAPLTERAVQAVADITDSPAGLLLVPLEDGAADGGLTLEARWQWRLIEVPAIALCDAARRYFEDSGFIVDLDDVREGRAPEVPASACPGWLLEDECAWALVPLLHYGRLAGVVVLARPPVARRLDWEDFDLLRVVGRQLASYLIEQSSQDALGEAQRFDEFNRRIAFVMHDIKNLASQLALLARNAEKHAENPAFRADMLVTLRSSADKLQGLLSRLGRYGAHGVEARESVAVDELLARVARRYEGTQQVVAVDRPPCTVLAHPEGLEQALAHLVQNAIEASEPASPVFLDRHRSEKGWTIEVVDAGAGMSADFVRNGLFRPFHSSKNGGFGIGAYEARELVRAMGGRLEVESREGLGTRFLLTLPPAGADDSCQPHDGQESEVA